MFTKKFPVAFIFLILDGPACGGSISVTLLEIFSVTRSCLVSATPFPHRWVTGIYMQHHSYSSSMLPLPYEALELYLIPACEQGNNRHSSSALCPSVTRHPVPNLFSVSIVWVYGSISIIKWHKTSQGKLYYSQITGKGTENQKGEDITEHLLCAQPCVKHFTNLSHLIVTTYLRIRYYNTYVQMKIQAQKS